MHPAEAEFAERFLHHRTIFPRDFLADYGFATLRSAGRVELMRLELGGLQPATEDGRVARRCGARRRSSPGRRGSPSPRRAEPTGSRTPSVRRQICRHASPRTLSVPRQGEQLKDTCFARIQPAVRSSPCSR